jgi:YHS domain-containing protein
MSRIAARPEPAYLAREIASKRKWLALGALALVSFLLTLDDTALSVPLPSIARDLGLGLSGLEWVVNAYTLALAALLLDGRFKEIAALERDPVCGMLVEPERAVRLEWEGEKFYFCAAGCRDQFKRERAATSDTLTGYMVEGARR